MRIRWMVWAVVLLALACGAIPAVGQGDGDATPADLRRLLSDPGCQAACVLGIEPGITTNAEVEAVFAQANIAYELGTIGLSNNRDYGFDAGSVSPYFHSAERQAFIWSGENEDGVVSFINLPIRGISVDDVLEGYGAPSQIMNWSPQVALVYLDQHIVFVVALPDGDMVAYVEILPPDLLIARYVEDVLNMLPCTQPAEICSIATATPSPTAPAVSVILVCLCAPRILTRDLHASYQLRGREFRTNLDVGCAATKWRYGYGKHGPQ